MRSRFFGSNVISYTDDGRHSRVAKRSQNPDSSHISHAIIHTESDGHVSFHESAENITDNKYSKRKTWSDPLQSLQSRASVLALLRSLFSQVYESTMLEKWSTGLHRSTNRAIKRFEHNNGYERTIRIPRLDLKYVFAAITGVTVGVVVYKLVVGFVLVVSVLFGVGSVNTVNAINTENGVNTVSSDIHNANSQELSEAIYRHVHSSVHSHSSALDHSVSQSVAKMVELHQIDDIVTLEREIHSSIHQYCLPFTPKKGEELKLASTQESLNIHISEIVAFVASGGRLQTFNDGMKIRTDNGGIIDPSDDDLSDSIKSAAVSCPLLDVLFEEARAKEGPEKREDIESQLTNTEQLTTVKPNSAIKLVNTNVNTQSGLKSVTIGKDGTEQQFHTQLGSVANVKGIHAAIKTVENLFVSGECSDFVKTFPRTSLKQVVIDTLSMIHSLESAIEKHDGDNSAAKHETRLVIDDNGHIYKFKVNGEVNPKLKHDVQYWECQAVSKFIFNSNKHNWAPEVSKQALITAIHQFEFEG